MQDLSYLDSSAGFNYCISELGNRIEPSDDPCWWRLSAYLFSDIPEYISSTIRDKIKAGELVIETPLDFSNLA